MGRRLPMLAVLCGCGGPLDPRPDASACLDFVDESYRFATVTAGTWVSEGVPFVNACEVPVEVRGADVAAPFGVDPFEPFAVPPGGRTELRVRFRPTTGGSWREVVSLDTSLGPRRTALLAEATGPAVALDTDRLDFGFTVPGCPVERWLGVRNDGTEALVIDAIERDSDEFVPYPVLPIGLEPGEETVLVVRYDPFDDGADSAELRLRAGRSVVASVQVVGTGEQAEFRSDTFPLTPFANAELLVVLGDTGTSDAAAAVRAALPEALAAAAGPLAAIPSQGRVSFLAAGSGALLGSPVDLGASDASAVLAERIGTLMPWSGTEAGLDRMDAVFGLARSEHWTDGWVGSRGPLSVIVVSDAADASESPVDLYLQRWQEGTLRNGLHRSAAIVGDVPTAACDGVVPGVGYHELAVRTRGVVHSICDGDLAEVVARAVLQAAGLETDLPLTRPAVPRSVRVTLEDVPVDGWTYDAERGVVRFATAAAPVEPGELRIDYTVAANACPE